MQRELHKATTEREEEPSKAVAVDGGDGVESLDA
jgi:hypothetical protein